MERVTTSLKPASPRFPLSSDLLLPLLISQTYQQPESVEAMSVRSTEFSILGREQDREANGRYLACR